jgi:hypothetical protein
VSRHGAVGVGEEVFAVAALTTPEKIRPATGTVGEEADALVVEGGGGVVEERREAFVDAGGVGVAGLAVCTGGRVRAGVSSSSLGGGGTPSALQRRSKDCRRSW